MIETLLVTTPAAVASRHEVKPLHERIRELLFSSHLLLYTELHSRIVIDPVTQFC